MNPWLLWLSYIILALILVGGVYLTLLTLPGIWVMVLATFGYALLTHFAYAGMKTLIAIVVLAVIAELVDVLAAGAGAKKAGASKPGVWGAFIGGIAGGFFLTIPAPVVGTIIGICIGTFVGALLGEIAAGTRTGKTLHVAISAAWGRLMGILIKLLFACVVLAIVLFAAMPPIHWKSLGELFHRHKTVSATTAQSSYVVSPVIAFG